MAWGGETWEGFLMDGHGCQGRSGPPRLEEEADTQDKSSCLPDAARTGGREAVSAPEGVRFAGTKDGGDQTSVNALKHIPCLPAASCSAVVGFVCHYPLPDG